MESHVVSTLPQAQQIAKSVSTKAPSIFLWPTVLGSMMLTGLVAALIDDGGVIETIAILLLCIPTVLMLYIYGLKRHINNT